jgi:hypothetical protein
MKEIEENMLQRNVKSSNTATTVDYCNLEYQIVDLYQKQRQHHKCNGDKRTLLFSHKEVLLIFVLLLLLVKRTGCDDTENFQKNSKLIEINISLDFMVFLNDYLY